MSKKIHTINIEEDIINKFKEEASKQNKSFSGSLEEALELWLEVNEGNHLKGIVKK